MEENNDGMNDAGDRWEILFLNLFGDGQLHEDHRPDGGSLRWI